MEYYYIPPENFDLIGNKVKIDEFQYKHLVKVLRKKVGDKITVTDGNYSIYTCTIDSIYNKYLECSIHEIKRNLYEPELKLHLFVSSLKNPDRFEFLIEKAVELGVFSITPVITQNSVKKNLLSSAKEERIKKIIISAVGQSQRCFLPALNPTITFNELLSVTEGSKNKIVMYEFENANNVLCPALDECSLLIGPEGGFSEDEILLLKNNNWITASLGERKLRSETAAIVSIYKLLNKLN